VNSAVCHRRPAAVANSDRRQSTSIRGHGTTAGPTPTSRSPIGGDEPFPGSGAPVSSACPSGTSIGAPGSRTRDPWRCCRDPAEPPTPSARWFRGEVDRTVLSMQATARTPTSTCRRVALSLPEQTPGDVREFVRPDAPILSVAVERSTEERPVIRSDGHRRHSPEETPHTARFATTAVPADRLASFCDERTRESSGSVSWRHRTPQGRWRRPAGAATRPARRRPTRWR